MPSTLKLTPELADALADAVRNGVPIETATTAAGIPKQLFYTWLQAAERKQWRAGSPELPDQTLCLLADFSDRIACAQAEFEASQVASVVSAAQQVNEKTGLRDWRANAWLLNNHPRTRARYRQEHVAQVTTTGTVHHEHTLTLEAPDDRLELWAALSAPEEG